MPMSSDTKRLLVQADWRLIRKRALGHARKMEQPYRAILPVSIAEEMVDQAIIKTLSGERVWNPTVVDLQRFLFEAIRSLYSNEIRKALNNPALEEYDDERVSSKVPTAEEAAEIKSRVGRVIRELHVRNPELFEFLNQCEKHGMFDGGRKSNEVAADMNMLASNFSKKRKKLIEFLAELHVELSSSGKTIARREVEK